MLEISFLLLAGKEITCPDLSPPRNGSVDFGTRVGETANYSCSTGLMLVGNMTRQCQSNGEWSGIEPRCGRLLEARPTGYKTYYS